MLDTVKVPRELEPLFERAQEYVRRFFAEKRFSPTEGTIDIFGERYLLVRAASMSVEFFETVAGLYESEGPEAARHIARQLLFDLAHAIGKQDARNFHQKLEVSQPIERLSAGPVHFAHTGWAFVEILPESRPSPDDDFYLIYDHPYSFEAAAWLAAGKAADFPVCVMNAGYSSGWCAESFGISLTAAEIICRAKGDPACRFIMAPPERLEGHIAAYLERQPELATRITRYEVPGFFQRKEIEARLRAGEARLRGIANGVPGVLYQFFARADGSFGLSYISDKAAEVMGLQGPAERAFTEILERTDPRDREAFLASIQKGRPDHPWRFEWRYHKPSGEMVWLQGSSVPELREGEIIFNGIVRDVTARKAIEERNAHLTSVLRAIRNVNQLITKEKDRARLMEGACRCLVETRGFFGAWMLLQDGERRCLATAEAGFEESSLSFLHHLKGGFLPGCAEQALQAAGPVAIPGGSTVCQGCPLLVECRERTGLVTPLRHDGRSFGLLFAATPASFAADAEERALFEEVAGDLAFALHGLELEEDRRLHQEQQRTYATWLETMVDERTRELQERERRLQQTVDDLRLKDLAIQCSLAGISMSDLQGKLLFVNRAFAAMYGSTAEELVGRPGTILIQSPQVVGEIMAAVVEQGSWLGEAKGKDKDGKDFVTQVTASLVRDEKGVPLGVVGSVLDLTERRAIEQRLQHAERLSILGQLAGGVGHELRNPLGAIKNAAYFLKLGVEAAEPEVQETLEILEREVNNAEKIIDSLLAFARPRPPSPRLTPINALVPEALRRCAVPAAVTLQTALSPELPEVLIDPDQVVIVLRNLIQNAVQAMPGGGRLTIATAWRESRVVITVADTGCGIPAGELERVFEPLFTTKAKGIGLGLAISRILIEGNGGSIEVASAPGEGSTFTIRLPGTRTQEVLAIKGT